MTDKICLSFYITKNHLDLADIRVEGDDVYQAYWNTTLIPLYDRAHLCRKFYEQNMWVQKYLPNTILGYHLISRWKILDTGFSRAVKNVGEWIFGASFFENKLRILQRKHLQQRETVENQSVEESIVMSDMMLKFHKNDRKKQFQSEWKVKWQ